jgi:hypothetical protein
MKYIHLHTADNSYEANFIKDDLANEGIACMLTNEHFTTLMPYLNGMLGAGIQILVEKDNYGQAKLILDNRLNRNVQVCPNCHSADIRYGMGTKLRIKRLLALAIALLVVSPVRHIIPTYYCLACKAEFRE